MNEIIESRMSDLIYYVCTVATRPKEISYEYIFTARDIRETDFWAKRNDIRFGISAREYYDRNNMPLSGWGSADTHWIALISQLNSDRHFEVIKKNLKDWVLDMNKKHKELCEQEHNYKLLTEAPLNNKVLRKKRNLAV